MSFNIAPEPLRVPALVRFGIAVIVLTLAGHLFLGFEQSYLAPLVGLMTAYMTELGLETLRARLVRSQPRYHGGWQQLAIFLMPAHIPGLVIPMLIYTNDRMAPVVFTTVLAIASKYIFRVPDRQMGSRHFLNPSNVAIAVVLTTMQSVGIAPPYMFTARTSGALDLLLPMALICSGIFLNTGFTKKMGVVVGWLVGFFIQAVVRALVFGARLEGVLAPMTGTVFILFTFFMISDLGTVPAKRINQAVFGFSVAMVYMAFVQAHIVFGLFYALVLVCSTRGAMLAWAATRPAQPAQNAGQAPRDGLAELALPKPEAEYPPLSAAS